MRRFSAALCVLALAHPMPRAAARDVDPPKVSTPAPDLGKILGPPLRASAVVSRVSPAHEPAPTTTAVVIEIPVEPPVVELEIVETPPPARYTARPETAIVVAEPEEPQPEQGDVEQIVRDAAAEFDVDPDLLVAVARCESGLNPYAKNKRSTASGVMQFLTSTWRSQMGRLGYDTADVWSARAASRVAASMISEGGLRQWECAKNLGLV